MNHSTDKLRKSIIGILFIFFSISILTAQSPKDNQDKFWSYKNRLDDGFIRIGMEKGESIPMAGKAPHLHCQWTYFLAAQKCPKKSGPGLLFWGDSTIELGNYIAVLALTIRNLKDAGQDYEQEAKELYYAIKAFERLDNSAETYFGEAEKMNGFFMRDDVPADFFMEKNGGKKYALQGWDGYSCVVAHGACKLDDPLDGSVASQDQIMNLFFGFTFVCELIPEVKYLETNLAELAALQVHRVANYLAENKWKITSPQGESLEQRWGGNCMPFSYAIAATAERLTKGKYREKYQTGRSKRMGKIVLNSFNWAHGIQHERNLWMAYVGIITSGRWNSKKMTKRAMKGDREMYALAYAAINDVPLDKRLSRERIEEILNSAPVDGPCFNTPDCSNTEGWMSSGRWIHASDRNGNKYNIEREYNGLDYMLFYNLYHYLYKDTLPPYMKK